ncbi:MAG: hypothetical protein LBJ16_02400, partial [Holosporaceae bacterium]|nr:hypothetical protein [Holosporaceae bacterium]
NMRSFGNFCVASVLGSSCTTCTLRSCASYAPINSSKYLCLERSLIIFILSPSSICFRFRHPGFRFWIAQNRQAMIQN